MEKKPDNIRALIVDDEPYFYKDFREKNVATYVFEYANSTQSALEKLATQRFDIVLLDLSYPQEKIDYEKGLDFLLPSVLKKLKAPCPVIVVTHDTRIDTHKRALDNGASHLFRKEDYFDGHSAQKWDDDIRRVVELFKKRGRNTATLKTIKPKNAAEDRFISVDEAVIAIKKKLRKIAQYPNTYPVFLLGETGVGKEVAARYLHDHRDSQSEYIAVNLSALGENAFEGELFGSKPGAFTGAVDRAGLLEAAKGGTLLLDEIGEITQDIQVKLLRVIENRQFRRMGSTKNVDLDVQLIFSTNRNLEEAIVKGTFRRDFYERIRAVTIEIPPLRKRPSDIIPLINFFLTSDKVCPPSSLFYGKSATECFTERVLELFHHYSWPGNVRELRGAIQSALIEGDLNDVEKIDADCIPRRFMAPAPTKSPQKGKQKDTISAIEGWSMDKQTAYDELRKIEKALIAAGGRKSLAAKELGLKDDQILRYKVKKKYYLDYPELFEFCPSTCNAYKLAPGFSRTLNVFICYARDDAEELEEVRKHLKSIDGHYPLRIWYDNEIGAGESWDSTIKDRLEISDLFFLLISPSFLASEYILNIELEKAFERQKKGEAVIVPAIIKPCNWRAHDQLAGLQCLPNTAKPVSAYSDRNQGYLEVTEGIENTIKNIFNRK